jgi:hypothetical protein
MTFTLTSTTESQENLNRAASDTWRTPPPAKPEPAKSGDSAALDQLPPKQFNAAREEQIRESKDAARAALEGDDGEKRYRNKGSGGLRRRIDTVTKNWRTEESRRIAVEKELAGLKAGSNSLAPPSPTPPAQASDVNPPRLEQRPAETIAVDATRAKTPLFEEARKRYTDFDSVIHAADEKGTVVSAELKSAIRKMPNVGDIAYFLAKNPAVIKELEEGRVTVDRISADIERAKDPNFRRQVALQSHRAALEADHIGRLQQTYKTIPDAAKICNVVVQLPLEVVDAVYEQPNSHDIDIHLKRNPALVQELQNMSIPAAMGRIGRIAEQLDAAKHREKARPPAPISPLGSSSSHTSVPLDQLPMRDFIRERNRMERDHRRGR